MYYVRATFRSGIPGGNQPDDQPTSKIKMLGGIQLHGRKK